MKTRHEVSVVPSVPPDCTNIVPLNTLLSLPFHHTDEMQQTRPVQPTAEFQEVVGKFYLHVDGIRQYVR
jgi:hypothetical protein